MPGYGLSHAGETPRQQQAHRRKYGYGTTIVDLHDGVRLTMVADNHVKQTRFGQ